MVNLIRCVQSEIAVRCHLRARIGMRVDTFGDVIVRCSFEIFSKAEDYMMIVDVAAVVVFKNCCLLF